MVYAGFLLHAAVHVGTDLWVCLHTVIFQALEQFTPSCFGTCGNKWSSTECTVADFPLFIISETTNSFSFCTPQNSSVHPVCFKSGNCIVQTSLLSPEVIPGRCNICCTVSLMPNKFQDYLVRKVFEFSQIEKQKERVKNRPRKTAAGLFSSFASFMSKNKASL